MSGIFSAGGAGNVGVSGFYPVTINDSLRFEDGSSAYLNRTPSSAGNRRTWTWSGWVKLGNINIDRDFFTAAGSGTQLFECMITSGNTIQVYTNSQVVLNSTQVLRDTSAWYHLMYVNDTTQTTASNRFKIYLNGAEITTFATDNRSSYSQNFDGGINSTVAHYIGQNQVSGNRFDGYMAEVNFIDGQALDPTSFGEAKDGTWIPKSYAGSYGTNGFHLEFNGNSNDTSGNGNNWTANNISAHDYVPDSPTNNWVTLNTLDKYSSATISEGNLEIGLMTNSWINQARATMFVNSGKWYWEVYQLGTGGFWKIGIRDNDAALTSNTTSSTGFEYYAANGNKHSSSGAAAYSSQTSSQGNVYAFALDMDAGTLTLYVNNVSQGTMFSGLSGYYAPTSSSYNGILVYNFGQDSTFAGGTTAGGNSDANGVGDFKYSVPSGYLALCTKNLPEPTIIDGSEHFNTVLYTGNGTSQSITGVGFGSAPDLVWVKNRDKSDRFHLLTDTARGATKSLSSNLTSNEAGTTYSNGLTSFNSDGFSVGNLIDFNGTNDRMVAWNWKAGGSASSNSDGSITSNVSANVDAGFSIVSWTGTGVNATVGHGLASAPQLIIAKNRDTNGTEWPVLETLVNGGTHYLRLNENYTSTNTSIIWNNTNPTDSVFSIGTYSYINENTKDIIAYCFHSVDGYSKVGSYIGGGSNFPFVYTGFRPAWIMIKSTNLSQSWIMKDTSRFTYNVNKSYLLADTPAGEVTDHSPTYTDIVSNGFKLRGSANATNASGSTYMYLAFAETPQKFANAR